MKNIKARHLEKYDSEKYEKIAFGVLKNKSDNNYCFAFEAEFEESEEQYPLSDLLSQYGLACTDYYLTDQIIDGVKKSIIEVDTLDDDKVELIHILNFSTIVGRTIENVVYGKYALLALKYGIGKIKINDLEIFIPVYAYRNDRAGMMNFEIIYPEMQYKKMFEDGIEVQDLLPENCRAEFILLEKAKASIIFKKNEETHKLIYGLKGYEQTEKLEQSE